MRYFKKRLALSFTIVLISSGAVRSEEKTVTDAELKTVAELVELIKSKYEAGVASVDEVFMAERLHLRAQYFAGKLKREVFLSKSHAFHLKVINSTKDRVAAGVVGQSALIKAYEDMFTDRQIK